MDKYGYIVDISMDMDMDMIYNIINFISMMEILINDIIWKYHIYIWIIWKYGYDENMDNKWIIWIWIYLGKLWINH